MNKTENILNEKAKLLAREAFEISQTANRDDYDNKVNVLHTKIDTIIQQSIKISEVSEERMWKNFYWMCEKYSPAVDQVINDLKMKKHNSKDYNKKLVDELLQGSNALKKMIDTIHPLRAIKIHWTNSENIYCGKIFRPWQFFYVSKSIHFLNALINNDKNKEISFVYINELSKKITIKI